MARTSIAATAVSSTGYPTAGTTITFTAADTSNQNSTPFTGREIIIATNTHATDPFTVTITSVADSHNRTGSITAESLAAGVFKLYGPFRADGWQQSDGTLYFQGSDASIKFKVIQF